MSQHAPSHQTAKAETATEALRDVFPYRDQVVTRIGAGLRRDSRLPLYPPYPGIFGLTAELAAGWYLATRPPYLDLLDCVTPSQARRIAGMSGFESPLDGSCARIASWVRSPRPPDPGCLYTAAARLVDIMALRRHPLIRSRHADEIARLLRDLHPRFVAYRSRHIWANRPAFHLFWRSFATTIAPLLRALGQVYAQAPLGDGARYADFLIGSTVVEMKTGHLDSLADRRSVVDQLLTYSLLAHHDGYSVTHVALYAARHQQVLRYRLHKFCDAAAGATVDITAVAGRLAAAIGAEASCLPDRAGRYPQHAY